MKFIPLVWKGIWRKPGRTMLTALQVLVTFALFALLQGMKSGVDDAVGKLKADLFVVQHASGFAPLPLAMDGRIRAVDGVKALAYEAVLAGTYQEPTQQVFALALEPDGPLPAFLDFALSPAAIRVMQQTRTGALVSDGLARKYGWKIGARIPLHSQTLQQDGSSTWSFDIVGYFTPGNQLQSTDLMIINYAYLDTARQNDTGTVQRYYIEVADSNRGLEVARAVDKLFTNSSDETRTESLRESVQASLQSLGDLDFVIRAVVGAALFALIFSTTAMMMQSILERTAELAVLKTVGFSDAGVFWIVMTEVLVVCMVAACGGLAVASWMLPLARSFTHIQVSMPRSVVYMGLALAAGLAIVTGTMPAVRARRMPLVTALAGR